MNGVTLLITTYNWETALDLVLASVHAQHVLPAEVLIADDGSGPATRAVVERWTNRIRAPVRHIWQEDRGFRLSASRNRALSAARGEYNLMVVGEMVLPILGPPEPAPGELLLAQRCGRRISVE